MIQKVRTKINDNLGKEVRVKYNLGRNKYEEYDVILKEIYENVFLVDVNDRTKSFTYVDVITKNLKIKY